MSVESSVDTLQVVVFCLLDQTSNRREEYGIGVEQVQEIRFLENITRIPKAPSHVIGVMNL
ncbi:MAG: chemotaxis protein CheW, partial [Nitrosopumilaceae archaeon]|nr:chemotaxis protein CheW [Nitrosopumilaceae archaeon]